MRALRVERLLARTFFRRFFESELMPAGLPQVQLLIWGIALFAAPGYLGGFLMGIKYDQLSHTAPLALPAAMRADALFFVTFGTLALGMVGLIVWEGVFPDRRDARTLGVLPLEPRTLIVARLGALAAVAGLFAAGIALPATIVYGPAVGAYEPAASSLRTAVGHFLVTSMGGLFAFFLVIAAQGMLLNLFGRRVAQRLALVLQILFVVGLLQMFLLLPLLSAAVSRTFEGAERSWVALLPPAWFLALYEVATGSVRVTPPGYALTAALATVVTLAGAMALVGLSHRRLVRMALEAPDSGSRMSLSRVTAWTEPIAARIVRHPVQRAIAGFTLRTLARSRAHTMWLVTFVGVGIALVVSVLLPLFVVRGLAAFESPTAAWLSVPLILIFFALCGIRSVLAIPADLNANWLFRLHASDRSLCQIVGGVRTALLLGVVTPVALGSGLMGAYLWGGQPGVIHGVVTAAFGVLLVDLLLVGLRKVPFACTYYPGRSRARILWPLYAAGFGVYAFSLAALEAAALTRPLVLVSTLAAVGGVSGVLACVRRWDLQPPPGLMYEETDADGPFQGFRLSEGLAAESRGLMYPPANARADRAAAVWAPAADGRRPPGRT